MKDDKKIKGFYKNKKVLIPGGAGFIGSNLARRLVLCGTEVTICDSFNKFCGANLFNINDMKNRISLVRKGIEDYVKRHNMGIFDVIFNCVGLTDHHIGFQDPEMDYKINCLSGLKIMKKIAAEKASCKMISIGSRSQYGRTSRKFVDESYPMNPIDVQSIHKLALEHYHSVFAGLQGLDLIYLRLTNVYGPGQRLKGDGIGLMGETIRSAISGNEVVIFGSLSRVKDILFVDDVIDALLLLGIQENRHFSVYNVGGEPHTLGELTGIFKKNIEAKIKVIPFSAKIKKMDTGDIVLKADALTKATGWAPRTAIDKGIATTLDYYRQNKRYYL